MTLLHRARTTRRIPLQLVLSLVLVLTGLGLLATTAGRAQSPSVVVVPVDDTITPPLARFVTGAISDANAANAAAIVLAIDTPGGLMSASDEIIAAVLASDVPVIAYVSPSGGRAASAGVFITYAAPLAAMAPGTRIGSASPVLLDDSGAVTADDTVTAKITNDAVSQIKNLANRTGRNAAWAEQAVRDAANITADEALSLDVIDLIAPTVADLLTQVDGETVTTAAGDVALATAGAAAQPVAMTWLDELLQLLASPTVAYILLSLGSVGIILELSNPGAIAPGVVGVLALLLGLYSLGTLPVNWTGVLLIVFAFALFAIEIFVTSYGILSVGAIVSFVIGSYLLIDTDVPGFAVARPVIWTMTACLTIFFLLIGGAVLKSAGLRPVTGKEALIGVIGTVRQPLGPDGIIFATGELWQASLRPFDDGAAPLPAGTAVMVTAVEDLRLIVQPATAAETAHGGVAIHDDRIAAPSGVSATVIPPATARPDGTSGVA